MTTQEYQTHYNGSRPFNVSITNIDNTYFVNVMSNESTNVLFKAHEVFIGKSPKNEMTEFSGGFGEKIDGNSLLIKINLNEYVYIGNSVFSFLTDSPIISYISPVGNNDVPYPYAVLENGNIYLMLNNVILLNTPNLNKYITQDLDPYTYYYKNHYITPNYRNIKQFKIGGNVYAMTHNANPDETYERFELFENENVNSNKTIIEIFVGEQLEQIILTKEMYVEIIESFGNLKEFSKYKSTQLE